MCVAAPINVKVENGKILDVRGEEVIEALAAKLKEYMDAGHAEYFEIWWGCPYQQDNMYLIHYWSVVIGAVDSQRAKVVI